MATGLVKKALANVRRFSQQAAQDRQGDYRAATGAVGQLYRSLGVAIDASGNKLTAQNDRILSRMQSLVAAQRQAVGGVSAAQQATTNDFGGVTSDFVSQQFGRARASAEAGVGEAKAGAAAGKAAAASGADAVSIARAGAQEAKAGAQYGLSQALASRQQQDVQAAAQMRQQVLLQEMQQQYQLEAQREQAKQAFATWKRQQTLLGNITTQHGNDVVQVADGLGSAIPTIQQFIKDHQDQTNAAGQPMSAVDVLKSLSIDQGNGSLDVATTDPQMRVYLSLINSLMQGNSGTSAALSAIESHYPQFSKYSSAIRNAIAAQLKAYAHQQQATADKLLQALPGGAVSFP